MMGWAHGVIDGREVGYGVEAVCDREGCDAEIDRGLSYRCGSYPDQGCNGYFCERHLFTTIGRSGFWCRSCLNEPRCEACGEALDEAMYEDGSTEVICPFCDE